MVCALIKRPGSKHVTTTVVRADDTVFRMTKLGIRIRRNRVAKSAEAMRRERNLPACAFVFTLILSATSVCAQLVPGSMDVRWDAGAPDCKANPQPPIQVHRYEPETFFLRQNLCVSFEGNFLYLLIGSHKALLIDSGRHPRSRSDASGKNSAGLIAGAR